ncbi:hypothetical protein [Paracoccus xiamenensis]|uniref:hypothetical protein n=1 Tax=Paracoccus xiamenensis TaxID=2714901 RepID=UPI001407C278|nr:hypothetical protein [Paracoccus xiamenensis]NHF73505.1 hypothetical protein [Paracoccus xiamenensis]
MAIEYSLYYRGTPQDLRAAIDRMLPTDCFTHVSVGPTTALAREILFEEGFSGDYAAMAWLRLDKARRSQAIAALRRFRDGIGRDNILILFQNECELPPA